MSVSSGLRAISHAQPRNAVTVQALTAAGHPSSGVTMDETTARKLSAVDRCMEILSDSMGKLPSFVIDNRTMERIPHDILRLLNIRPNEAMTPFIRKKVLENSRNEGGAGYDWIIKDPRTLRPVELIPVPWWLVTPWRDQAGRVWYTVTHPATGAPMVLPNEDICHYKATTRDGLKGIAPLKRAQEVLAIAGAAQQYERGYYERGGQPSGVLKTESDLGGYAKDAQGKLLTDPDGTPVSRKEQLRREWEKVHTGPSKSHRIAILDLGLTYTPMAATNRDAQFVESKEVSVKDICRFFGIPTHFLGEGKESYASNEQTAIEFVMNTLQPIVTQYEEEQTWKLLTDSELAAGLEIRINMLAALRGDNASRAAWYKTMREVGVFSANDIRRLEDFGDVPGGDTRYASLNYVPLEDFKELSRQRAGGQQAGK
ncbi:phage portal protein [uncultured Dysosmobacter sp.]|uniref:phage portal protein n=1 Tax=uncultured Dysosmobacter sp. TaxID=2591384 RepID=UPI002611393A|nr:phage portal protein [uncultured Dysosmobacter sp.]